ncbi:MAG: hypothetical protein ACTHN0_06585 [Aquihabitans sp.]
MLVAVDERDDPGADDIGGDRPLDRVDDLDDDVDVGTWRRDLGIVVGLVLVFVVVTWVALSALPGGESSSVPDDLERFDEIDLGELAGAEAQIGVTRSELLPVVVTGKGRGETSIQVVDVTGGTVTDAGPIPVEGWAVGAFPRASDAYVAVLVQVCDAEPVEGDGIDECIGDVGEQAPTVLAVYDIAAASWQTLPIEPKLASQLSLADVDGSTAILERAPQTTEEPSLWSAVDLAKPLALGALSEDGAPEPNGLIERRGHFDGWGWKASGASGWGDETTWTGEAEGRSRSEHIANTDDRRFSGAGPCLVISTVDGTDLEHLDRLCTT